ncbi:unnamed protein product [Somion occarium]|uniref:Uncharacterized protein n=1 Tax=Somion occarium TaxID=3059160 RepID=A0ABP1E3D4_9APHY
MPNITDIPVEIFLDNLLPILPVSDILRLGCTNRFFYLLTNDEPFWHQRLQRDFNFPSSDTARTTGWKFIYKRLTNPKVYVWGEASHSRLGIAHLPIQNLRDGVPTPQHLKLQGVKVVSLVAGGWSFHAIDSNGSVYVWGVMDGTGIALRGDGFSEASKVANFPMRLALPLPVRSVSCGRLHAAAFDATGHVWNLTSWGRPFRLVSALLDQSSPDSTPIQVECGWSFTSVLTESGDVIVWWPKAQPALEFNRTGGQGSSNYIPCHVWDLVMDPVRLPPIPLGSFPHLEHTGLSHEVQQQETKLTKIASMDNIVIGLTNKGHILRYAKLYNEIEYTQGRWEYLPYFSDLAKVRECAPFAEDSEGRLEAPQAMYINHISAHFRTFIAYSTGDQSVVLMGKIDTDDPVIPAPDNVRPIIHPNLQFKSVISVVLGDYHYGALTSTGKMFTWGAYSKGALGLGDPTKIQPGQPGGFINEQQRRAVTAAGSLIARVPDVGVPTEVKFERGRQTFCFAATAAGWHTGALVIDLDPDTEEREEVEEEPMRGSFPPTGPERRFDTGNPFTGHRGLLPFRVGFAGRGWGRASPR